MLSGVRNARPPSPSAYIKISVPPPPKFREGVETMKTLEKKKPMVLTFHMFYLL